MNDSWICPKCKRVNSVEREYCAYCQTPRPEKKRNWLLIVAIILAVLLTLALILLLFVSKDKKTDSTPTPAVTATPAATPTAVIETPDTSKPVAVVTPAPDNGSSEKYDYASLIGDKPRTEYGKYLRWYVLDSSYRPDCDTRVNIIGETYRMRKTNGVYNEGNYSNLSKYNKTGYYISFYYADGVLYYAEIRDPNKQENILVKLYFWAGEIIGERDYRVGKGDIKFADVNNITSIQDEFSEVYDVGMNEYYSR